MDLALAIQRTIVRIRISVLNTPCVPIFKMPLMPIFGINKQLWLFWPKFDQKGNKDLKFRKLMLE